MILSRSRTDILVVWMEDRGLVSRLEMELDVDGGDVHS